MALEKCLWQLTRDSPPLLSPHLLPGYGIGGSSLEVSQDLCSVPCLKAQFPPTHTHTHWSSLSKGYQAQDTSSGGWCWYQGPQT